MSVFEAGTTHFMIGLVAGLLLVVWRRRAVQILGIGQDVAWTSVVIAFIGFGGGLASGRVLRRFTSNRQTLIPGLIVALVCTSVLGQRIAPFLDHTMPGLASLRSSALANISICCVVSGFLEYLPLACLGMLFLILAQSGTLSQQVSATVGLMGVVTGLGLGQHWALPVCGIASTLAIALSFIICVPPLQARQENQRAPSVLVFLTLAGVLIFCLGKGPDAGYLYGEIQQDGLTVDYFHAAASGDVRVCSKDHESYLQLDGIEISGTGSSSAGEVGLTFLPRLLRPAATNVLVVGLGTGAPPRGNLLFPGSRVVCVENEAGIVSANIHSGLWSPASFTIKQGEAGRAIADSPRSLDFILVNYGDIRLPQTARCLTKGFCALAKNALSVDGILAERLRLDSISPADLALIVRTVLGVFPHATLAYTSDSQGILIASASSLIEAGNSTLQAQTLVDGHTKLLAELERRFGTASVSTLLSTHLWLGEEGFKRLRGRDQEQTMLTGWNMQMRSLFRHRFTQGDQDPTLVRRLLAASVSMPELERMLRVTGPDGKSYHEIASFFAGSGQLRYAFDVLSYGLAQDPNQADLLVDQLIWSNETDLGIIAGVIAEMDRSSCDALNRMGVSLWGRQRFRLAIPVFERLVNVIPNSATAWANLAANHGRVGDVIKARECMARALALDPLNEFVALSGSNPPPRPVDPSNR